MLQILSEIAAVGKMLIQSRIAGNYCRDAESGRASFLVLKNVRVTTEEGSLELAELGTQLSAANVEAANNDAKMERKVSDISS